MEFRVWKDSWMRFVPDCAFYERADIAEASQNRLVLYKNWRKFYLSIDLDLSPPPKMLQNAHQPPRAYPITKITRIFRYIFPHSNVSSWIHPHPPRLSPHNHFFRPPSLCTTFIQIFFSLPQLSVFSFPHAYIQNSCLRYVLYSVKQWPHPLA